MAAAPVRLIGDLLPRETRLLAVDVAGQISDGLLEQLLIVDRDIWLRDGQKDQFVFQVLNTVFGQSQKWDEVVFQGLPIIQIVRRVNDSVHTLSRTAGAAKFKDQVAAVQSGFFCTACGIRNSTLHVDHIVPVSRGGLADHLTNLQLLCVACNTGKSALDGDLLPSIMVTAKTTRVLPRLRFKRLLLSATEIDGRMYGRCGECDTTSRDSVLNVVPRQLMAANLLNLIVRCEKH